MFLENLQPRVKLKTETSKLLTYTGIYLNAYSLEVKL